LNKKSEYEEVEDLICQLEEVIEGIKGEYDARDKLERALGHALFLLKVPADKFERYLPDFFSCKEGPEAWVENIIEECKKEAR